MPLLDTRSGKDLTGSLISDIVLQLLSYVAQTEREFIRARQAEGIAAAKARSVHCGRRAMDIPEAFDAVYARWRSQQISMAAAARELGVNPRTFKKWTLTVEK